MGFLFFSAAASASGGYFAYAEVPGPVRQAPSFYLLLSKDVCPSKKAPAGWSRGTYRYRYGDEPACWTLDGEQVKICPAGQYETTVKGTTVNPCHAWPVRNFMEP